MKNKRNKKKVISIVALVASFVLCIGATFGITMAYFGGSATDSVNKITLKTGIVIGAEITAAGETSDVLVVPSQQVDIEATGTVSAYNSGTNAVDGYVRAQLTVAAAEGATAFDTSSFAVTTEDGTTYWTKNGDYYYLVDAKDSTTLETVSAGDTVTIKGKLTVPATLGNEASGQAISATVVFQVVQAELYASDGTAATSAITDETVQAAFATVAA